MKLFTVPNLITLANLACGCVAIVFAFNGNLVWAAYLVGIAAVLDFLDGFVARALKQYSPIGKDLDSLADMVTFGVVPGVVMYRLLDTAFFVRHLEHTHFDTAQFGSLMNPASFVSAPIIFFGFMITLFSALRLAKFNNDVRQSDSFIGLPTPANSIIICSLPLILNINFPARWDGSFGHDAALLVAEPITAFLVNPWVLMAMTLILSYLLISELPLFALKFKSFKWKGNELRYSFLTVAVVMIALLKYIALPLVIVLYILLSIINNLLKRSTPVNPKQADGER